jgi:hypothetical protein
MIFERRSIHHQFCCPNYSSLLFKRSDLERFGNWDLVRFGADSELSNRICGALGTTEPAVAYYGVPLTLLGVRSDSLTNHSASSLLTLGYGVRREYINQYTCWHASELKKDKPFLNSRGRKPFSAPNLMKISSNKNLYYDFIFILDISLEAPGVKTLKKIKNLSEKFSFSYAVLSMLPFERIGIQRDPEVQSLIMKFHIPVIVAGDNVRCKNLVWGNPKFLECLPDNLPTVSANNTIILSESKELISFTTQLSNLPETLHKVPLKQYTTINENKFLKDINQLF